MGVVGKGVLATPRGDAQGGVGADVPRTPPQMEEAARTRGEGKEAGDEERLSAAKLASIMQFLETANADTDNGTEHGGNTQDEAASVVSSATTATAANSAAASVRRRIEALRHQLQARTKELNDLAQRLSQSEARNDALLRAAAEERDALTVRLKEEHEAASKRHLAFVDQLLADKAELAERCAALADQLRQADAAASEASREAQRRLTRELAAQKELLVAAERKSREQWMETKAKEVKEMTVKGLEPEIQRLVARHRADVERLEAAEKEALQRQHAELSSQHEAHVRQLRERMAQEQLDALERERSLGAAKAREAVERAEQQMQLGRMRMQAESDLRLERAEQSRREERERAAASLATAKEEHAQALAQQQAKLQEHLDTAARRADAALAAAKEEHAVEKEAFQRVTLERARKELAEKEDHIRSALRAERDAELKRVIARLETEAEDRLRTELRAREGELAELRTRGASDLAAERERVHALTLRLNESMEAQRHAETAAARHGERVRELEAAFENARAGAQAAAAEAEELRAQADGASGAAAYAAAAAQTELHELRAALAARDASLGDAAARHRRELEDVETRVRVALARKDETIASLREQLSAVMLQVSASAAEAGLGGA